jgi:hypothetical protein
LKISGAALQTTIALWCNGITLVWGGFAGPARACPARLFKQKFKCNGARSKNMKSQEGGPCCT